MYIFLNMFLKEQIFDLQIKNSKVVFTKLSCKIDYRHCTKYICTYNNLYKNSNTTYIQYLEFKR